MRKGECPYGHALRDPNLVPSIKVRGIRNCLACSRARAYARHYELQGDIQGVRDRYYEEIMA